MDLFDLTGKVAIVSGGGGWLGTHIVSALAGVGAHVIAVSRNKEKLETALSGVTGKVTCISADVTSEQWPSTIANVADSYGIDILVNNAHVGRGGSLRTSTEDEYREGFELAVVATSTAINAARPALELSAGRGNSPSIINISSMYGTVAPDGRLYEREESRNPPFYGAAKAALLQLTRYAASELGASGIRVNAITPGPFPGPAAQEDPAFVERLAARTMLGRIGVPAEIATAILFLASPHSSYVTGITVPVDGGWTAW